MESIQEQWRGIRRKILLSHLGGVAFLGLLGLSFLVFTLPVNPLPLRDWLVAIVAMLALGTPIGFYSPRFHQIEPYVRRLAAGERFTDEEAAAYQRWLALHPIRASWVGLFGALSIYAGGAAAIRWVFLMPWDAFAIMLICGLVSGLMWAVVIYFVSENALRPLTGWAPVPRGAVRRVPLGVKIFGAAATLITAALGWFGVMAFVRAGTIIETEVGQRIFLRAVELSDLFGARPALDPARPPDSWADTADSTRLSPHGFYHVIDRAGRILATYPRDKNAPGSIREAPLQKTVIERILREREGQVVDRWDSVKMVAFVPIADHPLKLVAIAPRADFGGYLNDFLHYGLIAMGFSLTLAVGIAYLSTRSVTIPLAEVTRTAQAVAAHRDLGRRVPFTTSDEVGDLAQAFNEMARTIQTYAEELESLVAQRTAELEKRGRELQAINRELEAKSKEMRDFLHVVSHDLRAPLINVQGFSSALEEAIGDVDRMMTEHGASAAWTEQRDEIRESLDFILRGIAKMDLLVKGLLELARIDAGEARREPIDTNKMLRDIVDSLQFQIRERDITVHVDPLPPLVGDPIRIGQVFGNLIDNAIKYMKKDGERRIDVGCDEVDGFYRFRVRDTGPGIKPADQEKVFRLFARVGDHAGVHGDGIGLAAVRKIVEKHGGTIGVESEPGKGSTFWFTVPREA